VNRQHIQRLLGEAARLTKHRDYVIIGSLSVLGAVAAPNHFAPARVPAVTGDGKT